MYLPYIQYFISTKENKEISKGLNRIFMYNSVEVRLPIWLNGPSDNQSGSESSDSTSTPSPASSSTSSTNDISEFENKIIANSTATPYNHNRSKPDTMRLCIDEC